MRKRTLHEFCADARPRRSAKGSLALRTASTHALPMFMVTEADAAAIRTTYEQDGELSAAIELRRRFPGIVDNARARECARSIAGWTPQVIPPVRLPRRKARKLG